MRKLVYSINLSIDGCCDHTKMMPTEDVHLFYSDLLRSADTLLYGRKTYELMVPFWPDIAKNHSAPIQSMNDFADAFVSVKNIVVCSKSLKSTENKNTKIIHGDLREEILKLKQEPGRDILLGGVDIPSQLIKLNLVDEYLFVVQPVLVGEGRRLLDGANLPAALQLKLVETKVTGSGCITVRYSKN